MDHSDKSLFERLNRNFHFMIIHTQTEVTPEEIKTYLERKHPQFNYEITTKRKADLLYCTVSKQYGITIKSSDKTITVYGTPSGCLTALLPDMLFIFSDIKGSKTEKTVIRDLISEYGRDTK